MDAKEKIKEVVEVWEQINQKPNLTLISVNLKTNSKWAVNPHTHNKICEDIEKSLAEAKQVKTIPMGQGNKSSRILAWTYFSKEQKLEWQKKLVQS